MTPDSSPTRGTGGARRRADGPKKAGRSARAARSGDDTAGRDRTGGTRGASGTEAPSAAGTTDTTTGAAGATGGDRTVYISGADLQESFDEFYRDARDRLLVHTFGLCGDLAVARSAVREAYVVAWHHWRKTGRLDSPEAYVRPLAWRKALRRTATRPWHRKADVDGETRQVLEALGALPLDQRKALLLTQLVAVTMEEMAAEVGLAPEAAERELQLGAAQFALALDIPTSAIPLALSTLNDAARDVTWPRVTIVRRAGAARRRAHTIIGGVAAVVVLVAAGAAATDTTGARPTLDREDLPVASVPSTVDTATASLPDTALLPVETVQQRLGGRWQEGATSDNSTGNGMVLPCQGSRYADPQGTAAWVRAFRDTGRATRSAIQYAEGSANEERAQRTYKRTVRWFAGCVTPPDDPEARIQLMSTATLPETGDQSALFVLRSRAKDASTYVVGVARTGLMTTVVSLTTTVAPERASRDGVAGLVADAVNRMCPLADGGACAPETPTIAARLPFKVGATPWMLSEVDLPPLERDQGPWAATPPARLEEDRIDSGAIGCDTAHLFGAFRGQQVQRNQFRTFVLNEATKLPPEVGLTQTVGSLPRRAATAYVARFREQMAACPDLDSSAGTEVAELGRSDARNSAMTAWRLTTALPNDRSVVYDVAVARQGTSLSVLVWVSAPRAQIAEDDFVALSVRALERVGEMGPYDRG